MAVAWMRLTIVINCHSSRSSCPSCHDRDAYPVHDPAFQLCRPSSLELSFMLQATRMKISQAGPITVSTTHPTNTNPSSTSRATAEVHSRAGAPSSGCWMGAYTTTRRRAPQKCRGRLRLSSWCRQRRTFHSRFTGWGPEATCRSRPLSKWRTVRLQVRIVTAVLLIDPPSAVCAKLARDIATPPACSSRKPRSSSCGTCLQQPVSSALANLLVTTWPGLLHMPPF